MEKTPSRQAIEALKAKEIVSKVGKIVDKDSQAVLKAVRISSQRLRAFMDDGVIDLEFTEPGELQLKSTS